MVERVGFEAVKFGRGKRASGTVYPKTPGASAHALDPVDRFDVSWDGLAVRIVGLNADDAWEALALLSAARNLQFKVGSDTAAALLRTLSEADVDLNPPALVEQARRQGELRQRLLQTPAYSHRTLGEVRGGASEASTRTWVSRIRDRHRLFTVRSEGRTVIPAFQFDEHGEPRPELEGMLQALLEGGVEGWTLWAWATSPTPLLSGDVPIDVALTNPERVTRAATRFASQNRSAA